MRLLQQKLAIAALFFSFLILMLIFCQIGFAQGNEGKFGIGAKVSYLNFSDDDYSIFGTKINVEVDDATGFGANLTFFVSEEFSLEVSVDYIKTDVTLSALGASGDAGEITQIPFLLSGRAHIPTNSKVTPYFSFNLVYNFNDFDQNDTTIEFIYGPGAKVDIDNSLGFGVGAGVEIFLTEKAALNLDVKYIWNEFEASVNVPGFTDETFEINPFILGLGIKYYFN